MISERLEESTFTLAGEQVHDNPNGQQALNNLETAYKVHNQAEMLKYVGIVTMIASPIVAAKT